MNQKKLIPKEKWHKWDFQKLANQKIKEEYKQILKKKLKH